MSERHFVYLTEADVSVNYGRGINEREFVRSLLEQFEDEVTCIVPEPAEPENFSDPRLVYVKPHRHSGIFYPRYLLSAWRRILAIHSARSLEALVIRLDVTPLIPYLVQNVLGVPVILKGLINRQSFGQREYGSFGLTDLAKRIFRPMFRTVIEEAVAADTVSGTIAEGLQQEFELEYGLEVIPNGANLDLFQPGSQADARRALGLDRFDSLVGYVGTITEFRELDVLAEAFKKTVSGGNVGLVFVGDGPYRGDLERKCSDLGIMKKVHFTGWIPYDQIPRCLRALDIGVDLSRVPFEYGGTMKFATYSQKLAQYLGSGVPVLAWKMDDTAYLEHEDIGAVATPGDVTALAAGLERLLSGTVDHQVRSERTRRYAEEHLAASALVERRMNMWRKAVAAPEGTKGSVSRHSVHVQSEI